MTKPELFQRHEFTRRSGGLRGAALGGLTGEGHLLWASDYPHPDSVWPNSRDAIERQMHHLTPRMRRALTHDNAAALYGLA